MFLAKNKKLLEAFQRGDRDAMETVYKHYHRGVSSFLRKGFTFRSGTTHYFFRGIMEPNELKSSVQEVFRRAFEDKARHSYNGVNSFGNWLLAISRNMVINQFRNREIAFSSVVRAGDERSHLAILDDEVTEEYSGLLYGNPARPQDFAFERDELRVLIEHFTAELSDTDQQLLVLRFTQGVGQQETAKLLGTTRMKVRTAEARLRHRLRAYLQRAGYLEESTHTDERDQATTGEGELIGAGED